MIGLIFGETNFPIKILKKVKKKKLKYLIIDLTSGKKFNSSPPKTLGWLDNICSTRVVPERGIPRINIGVASKFPDSLNLLKRLNRSNLKKLWTVLQKQKNILTDTSK